MKKVFIVFSGLFLSGSVAFSQQDSMRLVDLQEVQVLSTRATDVTPVAYSNLRKEEIKKQNFGQDIPFLLSLTPSVVATSDAGMGVGYTSIRVRGTDASRINVTANGIPINDAESQSVFWVNMPDFASSLEDLQIQRGVGTSTNGAGAFGASLNMKTENLSFSPYAELNGSYGSFNTSKLMAKVGSGLLHNHWAVDARISGINSDGFIDRASTNLFSYFLQGGFFGENTVVKLLTFGGKERTYHAWDGVPKDSLKTNRTYNPCGYMGNDAEGNPLYYEGQTDNYNQTHYQLLVSHTFTPSLNLDGALYCTKGKGYYEEYKRSGSLAEYGLTPFVYQGVAVDKSDLVRQKWLDNTLGGGVFSLNYNKEKLSLTWGGGANKYAGNHFGKILWIKDYTGDASFSPGQEYYRGTGDKIDVDTYLKANYTLFDALHIYADLQYRFIDYKINGQNDVWDWINNEMQQLDIHKQFNFFNPKAGLSYKINDFNRAYASFAVGHREPSRNNYTDAELNVKPTYEEMFDYEAGYTFANKTFSAGVNLYYMDYNNQLVLTGKVNEIGEALTTNIADSYRAGIELVAGVKILSWLKWNGNMTLSKNEIKNYSEFVDLYDENWEWKSQVENKLGTTPISFSPNVIANSIFSFDYRRWNAALQSNYVGKQYIDNTGSNERSLDPYFLNNIRLGYTFNPKFLKEIGVSLLLNNVLNEQYESNAWVYSSYQQPDANSSKNDRYEEFGYFPQAGFNVMVNVSIKL